MRKLLLFVMGFCLLPLLMAQEPGSLIISEGYLGAQSNQIGLGFGTPSYIELYNPGDTAVDLSEYRISSHWNSDIYTWSVSIENNYWPKGMLEPKDFHIIAVGNNVAHGLEPGAFWQYGNRYVWELADYITNYDLSGDSTDRLLHSPTVGVFKIGAAYDGSDSLMDILSQRAETPIAGDPRAANKVSVRKFSVKQGNPDFDDSRGTNREDSEWIVTWAYFERDPDAWEKIGTTLHNHMDQTEGGVTGLVPGISVDKSAGTISVPYGIRRDTIFRAFNTNPNVHWKLDWAPTIEDSTSFIMRTGDTLTFFVCGNVLTEEKYQVVVSEPTSDFNKVYPKYTHLLQSDEWIADNPDEDPWYWTTRYEVTEGVSPIDSVYNVPWGTPVDTLTKYLHTADNSTLSFIWIDGKERPELMEGDTLLVTAEDGSVKKYYMNLLDYAPSSEARLAALIVDGDSLENFASGATYYNIKLSPGTTMVPSVVAVPQNQDAIVVAEAPAGLSGSDEERTTLITVTAQDDTTIMTYKIVWSVQRNLPMYFAEPFVSHLYAHWWRATNVGCMAIYNPNEYPLDMSEYMMVSGKTLQLIDQIKSADSTRILRPGYKLVAKDDEKHYFETQFEVPVRDIVPSKETFAIIKTRSPFNEHPEAWVTDNGIINDGFWIVPSPGLISGEGGESFGLLKILNDSILTGTKAMEDITPFDIEMIDQVNAFGNTEYWVLADTLPMWNAKWSEIRQYQLIRKSHIQKGNVDPRGSFGTDSASCEWDAYNFRLGGETEQFLLGAFGYHLMEPVTDHLPTVQSTVYIVSGGSSDNESILGVVDQITVVNFLGNLTMDDPDQTLVIRDGSSGNTKTGSDTMVDGDSLLVTSADGNNTTKYVVNVTAEGLESDALLTSDVYTITTEAESGTISGITAGTTLEEVNAAVTAPATATLDIVDNRGQIVSLEWFNTDTVMTKALASDSIWFRVTAQDKVTVIRYRLVIDASASDAYVLSSVYSVTADPVKVISSINYGASVKTFLGNLIPAPGASVKVYNKMDLERVLGDVQFDDYVKVVSEDGNVEVIYDLRFFEDIRSSNATLAAFTYDNTDVPGFDTGILEYEVELEAGTEIVPVVDATASNPNASVTVVQATNLTGTEEERTATATVVAEDGFSMVFSITFAVSTVSVEDMENLEPLIYAVDKTIIVKLGAFSANDRVLVYDLTGKQLVDRRLTNIPDEITMDVKQGIYIVKVISNREMFFQRVYLK